MFGDYVGDECVREKAVLGSVADVVSGITKGRKIGSETFIEVPYMAVSNVKSGYIDYSAIKTIVATEAEVNRYRLLSNDILMTEGGDPDKLGRGAVIKNPPRNCIHQNHVFRVRLNHSKVIPDYFQMYLQHRKSKNYFLKCAKQTTGIASINMRQLRSLPVPLPPLPLQQQFAAFAAEVDKSKFIVRHMFAMQLRQLYVTAGIQYDHVKL